MYLHNLTTILADPGAVETPGRLNYSIDGQPTTVHDLLLQKSDGTFFLVVWDERLKGSDDVIVKLARHVPVGEGVRSDGRHRAGRHACRRRVGAADPERPPGRPGHPP